MFKALKEATTRNTTDASTTTSSGPTMTTSGMGTTNACATEQPFVERRETAPVVHESIQPKEHRVVQPVIHRDREQVEVHHITQPIIEKGQTPVEVQESVLPEVRHEMRSVQPEVIESGLQGFRSQYTPIKIVQQPIRTVEEKPPIVQEHIHKKIIEEVQPVIQRNIQQPVLLKETVPVYEKVVEQPVFQHVERPTIYRDQPNYPPQQPLQQRLQHLYEQPQQSFQPPLQQPLQQPYQPAAVTLQRPVDAPQPGAIPLSVQIVRGPISAADELTKQTPTQALPSHMQPTIQVKILTPESLAVEEGQRLPAQGGLMQSSS